MLLTYAQTENRCETYPASFQKRPRVLVVDDSALGRQLVGRLLEGSMGAAPVYARDGIEALDLIANDPPSAVVTDLIMPRMNGHELVVAIHDRYPHIPVILTTAHGSEEVAIRALQAGAAGYVTKKTLVRDLVPAVERIFETVEIDRTRRRLLGSMKRSESYYSLENDPALITPLIQIIQDQLHAIGFCDGHARMRVCLALREALANALYHGNLEVSSDLRQDDERLFYGLAEQRRRMHPYRDRSIEVTTRYQADEAVFIIRDEGPGFDTSLLEREVQPEDLLRVGGQGLVLIRTFMDEVRHNASGNEITLIKRGAAPTA